MKRTKHSLSHYKLTTMDFGKLVPVGLLEALPGDTFQQSTSLLVRMSPLLAPVMHPVSIRIHHWFVPFRLVWDQWEDFITGGKDGLGNGAVYPVFNYAYAATKASLADYFGIPVSILIPANKLNSMPFRAYNMIYNEFYRDEDLVTEVVEDNNTLQSIAWEKDYFTTARPWTQKGPDVNISGVINNPTSTNPWLVRRDDTNALGTSLTSLQTNSGGALTSGGSQEYKLDPNGSLLQDASVNEFRRAFALQRYQEARAQYGSRYTEYLRYIGVTPSDARLQRPEYLGGGKQTLAFSEVLKTGAGEDPAEVIGSMKGHGIAAMRSNRYRYYCQEHGYIMSLMSIRPRTMYINGLERIWTRRTKEEYWQKELELIGQQEIKNQEVFVEGDATDDATFGYQDRYSEYRHQRSAVCGDFRDTLAHWHLARDFTSTPVLNQSFIECDPSKRIFAEQTAHPAWCMVSHSVNVRRQLGKRTIGRII